jgi:hypothetical protein
MLESPRPWVAVLPTLSLFVFWRVLAAVTPRPADAAEAVFLALPVALVTLTSTVLARWRLPVAVCWLALTAVALLPGSGGARALLVGLLCITSLALALLSREADALGLADWVALAIGLQALCEPALLLSARLDTETVLRLVLLPSAAAWCGHRLAALRGARPASIAAAAAVALEGGIGPVTCLGLLVATLVESVPAWRRARLRRSAGAATLAVAGLMALAGDGDWRAAVAFTALLAFVVPASVAASFSRFLLAAALGAGAVLLIGQQGVALVPAALLLALGPLGGEGARRVQLGWSVSLALGSAGLTFYPWLCEDPVPALSGILLPAPAGASLAWLAAALAVAALALLARLPAPRIASVLLVLGVTPLATPHARPLLPEPLPLSTERPTWSSALPAGSPLSGVFVDSYLSGAGSLPAGTVVGSVEVLLADGSVRRREILVGRDTADRHGVEPADTPWLADVPPGMERFGRSARMRWKPAGSGTARSLTVRLGGDLPADARLVLLWVGAAR